MKKIKLGIIVTSLYIKVDPKKAQSVIFKINKYFDVNLYLPKGKLDMFGSISNNQKIKLINKAASECEVLLSFCGGFNQVELLQYFDQLKFRENNIFVGQSDNTVLVNALPALKICKTLYGKGFLNMVNNPTKSEEMVENLYKSVTKLKSTSLNNGIQVIGGNNYTFDLLQGTRFCPKFSQPFILFMEGEDILKDSSEVWVDFIRNIDSIMLQEGATENIKGLLIGKFPDSVKLSKSQINKFIKDRSYLKNVPITIDYPCGHNKGSTEYLPFGEKISPKMLN